MRTPGFTAAPLGQTRRGDAARKGRLMVDTEASIIPAQNDFPTERIEQLALWKSRGEPKWLWSDRPRCPVGWRAVWISGPTENCCKVPGSPVYDPVQMRWVPGEEQTVCDWRRCGWGPVSERWECQPIRLRVVA
jgi:hypothetical protein